jgi:DNA-binding NarL/FixJ family response regulator
MIRVLLVDDHAVVRYGMRRAFEDAGEEIVGEAANGAEALEVSAETHPDIVLMDLSMPVMDGVATTARLTKEQPDRKVVLLTMHDDIERIRRAIDAGAAAYLWKGCTFAEVHDTVRAVASGATGLSPSLAQSMLQAARESSVPPGNNVLSPRQLEVLQLVASGLTTKEAARELGIGVRTAHNHLGAAYHRLGESSLVHAVIRAAKLGIIQLDLE